MSAFDYASTAQEAAEILAEFGALATVTATLAPLDDGPDTGQPTPIPSSYTAYAVVFDYVDRVWDRQPDALIQAGDRQIYFAAVDVDGVPVPEAAMRAETPLTGPDGDAYIIKNCKPLNPAGVVVMYDLRVRRP